MQIIPPLGFPVTIWWDGYNSSTDDLVIIDDPIKSFARYYASELKRIVVEHPVLVEPKGGMICMRPKQVIVLCNYTMNEYFGDDVTSALTTRFTQVNVDTREELKRFYDGWTHIGQDLTMWDNVSKTFGDVSQPPSQPPSQSALPDVQIDMADFFRQPAAETNSGATEVSSPNTGQ